MEMNPADMPTYRRLAAGASPTLRDIPIYRHVQPADRYHTYKLSQLALFGYLQSRDERERVWSDTYLDDIAEELAKAFSRPPRIIKCDKEHVYSSDRLSFFLLVNYDFIYFIKMAPQQQPPTKQGQQKPASR